MCAGEGRVGTSGGCQGDSGGPFVCEMGDTWYLQGAVSFGMTRCTTTYYYTVFTKITSHVSWLLEIIGLLLRFINFLARFNNSQTLPDRRLRVSLPSFILANLSRNRSLLQQAQNVKSVGCARKISILFVCFCLSRLDGCLRNNGWRRPRTPSLVGFGPQSSRVIEMRSKINDCRFI